MPYKQQGKDLQINLLDNDKETVWSWNNNASYNYSQKKLTSRKRNYFYIPSGIIAFVISVQMQDFQSYVNLLVETYQLSLVSY